MCGNGLIPQSEKTIHGKSGSFTGQRFGVSMEKWRLTSRRVEWYFSFKFTELHIENQIQQGFWSGRPENT